MPRPASPSTAAAVADAEAGPVAESTDGVNIEFSDGAKTFFTFLMYLIPLGLLIMLIVLPMAFSGCEYYEYCIKVRKSTGKVFTEEIYGPGHHMIGPDYGFKKFKATGHPVHFRNLAVFSQGDGSTSVGLEFKINIFFEYVIIKEQLPLLHDTLEKRYAGVVESRAIDGIKNVAANVAFSDYFQNRESVERVLRDALQLRLRPLHVELLPETFALGRVQIPEEVREKQLETKVQNERNQKELYLQQAQVERDITNYEVNKVLIQGNETERFALAEAALLRTEASASAAAIKRDAQTAGLKALYTETGLAAQKHKMGLDYLRTVTSKAEQGAAVTIAPAELAKLKTYT